MTATAPTATANAIGERPASPTCPACGAELQVPRIGRPPRWCSKACRQTGYRARQAADRAAEVAAYHLGQLAGAKTKLNAASNALAAAYAKMTAAVTADADGAELLATGPRWEMPLHDAARELERAARLIAELARRHHQAAADYRTARVVYDPEGVGEFRRASAAGGRGDETPAAADGVDRDELFDVVDDAVCLLGPDRALPADVDAALRGPAARLADVFGRQAGDGPLEELTAAAWALVDAARPFRGRSELPARFGTTMTLLASVLPARGAS